MAKRYATHLCFGYEPGVTPLAAKPATTPECEPHEPSPSGMAWFEWADRMARNGHRQRKCRGCGLYAVWEPGAREDSSDH